MRGKLDQVSRTNRQAKAQLRGDGKADLKWSGGRAGSTQSLNPQSRIPNPRGCRPRSLLQRHLQLLQLQSWLVHDEGSEGTVCRPALAGNAEKGVGVQFPLNRPDCTRPLFRRHALLRRRHAVAALAGRRGRHHREAQRSRALTDGCGITLEANPESVSQRAWNIFAGPVSIV